MFKMIEGGIIEDELDIDTLIHSGSRWYFIIRLSTIEKVKTDSSDGYFMGGNSLTGFTVASTIIMTNLSTEQIVGQNGQSYSQGMEVMAWEVTAAVAVVLLAWVFLPKYLQYGVTTISEFLELRYDTLLSDLYLSYLFSHTSFHSYPLYFTLVHSCSTKCLTLINI